ncbi:major capsid protein [Blackfly microvirus SF02]|uniref:Major capsid protein n=1 Tax=Blackfly microvirus SF02 TaxID=2576452 RepID=A0A4P8PLR8_9VIRU|nr:major capsid protein [Blackfly microvirus SF02]
MRSVSQHQFSHIPRADIQRSSFDRSHTHKTTFNGGQLIPIYYEEVLPGDTHSVNMTGFCRLSTPLHPVMDNIYMNTFWFFVPNRLTWDNWVKMNGEQRNPGDSTDFLVPQVNPPAGGFAAQSIYDYLGVPLGVGSHPINALFLRAYNLIWNEWFRDENLQASVVNPVLDGPDPDTDYVLLRRGKRHDYFTSSLPWPQKGESVSLPLGASAPIGGYFKVATDTGTQHNVLNFGAPGTFQPSLTTASTGIAEMHADSSATGALFADLSAATASTINQLRQAFQVQRLYERDARGGTRYTELVRSHFGVVSPDARLQRPEYLGGGQSPVNLHTVAQTSNTDSQPTPLANTAAYGTAVLSRHGFSKSFTEHGVILGLLSVRADLNYQQGLNRMWSRRSRFDYYWPALSHIGEQAVLSKEIYTDGTAGDETVWGYQERYAEYRYKPSVVTGEMRSSFPQSLDTWHLAQDFASRPLLNDVFIQDNPPISRVVAVPSEPNFIGDFYFAARAARPMPLYGVPGLIDHF